MKKDYTVLLIQLDGNLASDVSTRCSGRSQGMVPIKFNQENRVIFLHLQSSTEKCPYNRYIYTFIVQRFGINLLYT